MSNDEQCRAPRMHARNMGALKPNDAGSGSWFLGCNDVSEKGFGQDGRRSAGAQQPSLAHHCISDSWSSSTVPSKGITQNLPLPRALFLQM